MRRDHVGFAIFLVALLILPRAPLNVLGLPPSTTFPMGIVGLLVWGAISPYHLDRIRRPVAIWVPAGLVLLSVYALVSSFLSGSFVSAGYALQFFGYLAVGYLMLSGYVTRAVALAQTQVIFRIVQVVIAIFSVGLLVSIWTGPIYPHQVGGFQLSPVHFSPVGSTDTTFRAIGFGNGTNPVAASLLVFISLAGFFPSRVRNLSLAAIVVGTLLTLSRSSLLALAIALSIVLLLRFIAMVRTRSGLNRLLLVPILAVSALVVIVIVPSTPGSDPAPDDTLTVLVQRFSPSGANGFLAAYGGRVRHWNRGLNAWSNGSETQIIFGRGFRGSQTVSVEASAWATPHNSYIAFLGDLGIIGLMLLVLPILWTILVLGGRLMTQRVATREMFVFVGITALSIHSMTGLFLYSPVLITQVLMVLIFVSVLGLNVQEGTETTAIPSVSRRSDVVDVANQRFGAVRPHNRSQKDGPTTAG